jgi:molecular chaperone DnaK
MTATLPLANFPAQDFAPSHPKSQPQQSHFGVGVPLLIDVTPLSLCVETVGAYCDVIIDRNTPVPCERTREFVTVQDGQQVVKVRVAQGESRAFAENLLLGELELTSLRPAPRGELKISVTFGLDSDGILHVRAIDLDTGRAATSELQLSGIPSASDVAQMVGRHMTIA